MHNIFFPLINEIPQKHLISTGGLNGEKKLLLYFLIFIYISIILLFFFAFIIMHIYVSLSHIWYVMDKSPQSLHMCACVGHHLYTADCDAVAVAVALTLYTSVEEYIVREYLEPFLITAIKVYILYFSYTRPWCHEKGIIASKNHNFLYWPYND